MKEETIEKERKEKSNNSTQWTFINNTPTNYSLGMINDGRKTKGLFEKKPKSKRPREGIPGALKR